MSAVLYDVDVGFSDFFIMNTDVRLCRHVVAPYPAVHNNANDIPVIMFFIKAPLYVFV